jgi:hypothetical protein
MNRSLALLLFVVFLSACRNGVQVDVHETVGQPYPFVAEGSVAYGFAGARKAWKFRLPLHPGATTAATETLDRARFEARLGLDRSGTRAWYAVEVTEGKTQKIAERGIIPIR